MPTEIAALSPKSRKEKLKEWLDKHDKSTEKISVPDHAGFSWRKLWAFAGPGFLISIAYIDPGNFATDISAGAAFNYRMIWVLVFATTMGLFLQVLAARLGMVTKKHLAKVCRDEYGNKTPLTITLWLITESAIIASDIPEIIGTAFALNMLFGCPLWLGVLITAIDTMVFLGIQYFGIRYLEGFIGALVAVISCCFVAELWMSPIHWFRADCPDDWCAKFPHEQCPSNYCGTLFPGFIPRINQEGLYIAISLLGAVVMPHNLYLHSALVLSRDVKPERAASKEANLYNWIESTLALSMSAFVNICILSVAAGNFYPDTSNNFSTEYTNPDLDDTSRLLGNFLGKSASIVFGLALLAAGQSSTLTGTYAGQFVMEGFVEIKLPLWKRNLITRSIAILPSLIVAILAGKSGSTTLIILSSAILSFQLPFAIVPLVKFTSSKLKMGEFANSRWVTILMICLGLVVCSANVYLIYETFYGPAGIVTQIGSLTVRILLTILLIVVGILYFILIGYLVYRPVTGFEDPLHQKLLANGDNEDQDATELQVYS